MFKARSSSSGSLESVGGIQVFKIQGGRSGCDFSQTQAEALI